MRILSKNSDFGRKSRATRRRLDEPALVAIANSFAMRRCTILDISSGGAKLRLDDIAFLPSDFLLKMDQADRGRSCKVVWRRGHIIGVKFSTP